jgi:catechol 2,3-dioxygenase
VIGVEREDGLETRESVLAERAQGDPSVGFLPARGALESSLDFEQAHEDAAVEPARSVAGQARGRAQRERASRSDEVLDHPQTIRAQTASVIHKLGETIDPRTHIGHVHLKVSDLERAIAFYRDVLGFELKQQLGDQAAFLAAGGYHHHIGLNTWESRGGPRPPRGTTGLFHFAIRLPDRPALARTLKRVVQAGIAIGASDHGVSEAIYFEDPDGNGIEIYCDRPQEEWPRSSDGGVAMVTAPLDLEGLLAEAR